jgi:hypothetical protein
LLKLLDMANINPLNAELNPVCHVLALLGPHHILHVSGVRVKNKGKDKVITVESWTGPDSFTRSRLPDFKTIGTRRR